MLYILFLFCLILFQSNCYKTENEADDKLFDINYKSQISSDNDDISIEPGISKTLFLKYKKATSITFNIKDNDFIQINIHAINCNFDLEYKGTIIKQIDLDKYSLKISSENKTITIMPLLDVLDGKYKENYDEKVCPISINSYSLKNDLQDPELKIENKEESYFYLVPNEYNLLKISYDIKEVSEESYAGLFFQFNEKTNFSINITYKNKEKENFRLENIQNSTTLFLNSSFLLYDPENAINKGGSLSLVINNINRKAVLMRFKIIEEDSISLLRKDALNFGFLTSKTTYQYFYTEVFSGEEGELILHKKRTYGLLYGKIFNKSEISRGDLNDTSIYPNENTDNTTILEYNYHTLKLNFSFMNTTKCEDGCYLLITFEQKKAEGDFPLIGYEITILSRFWNYTDYMSQIIDIPFNEYLIGGFDMESISHHYYSLFIPEDADKIIIQIVNNYLDGFFAEGRIKINTVKQIGNREKLNLFNDQNLLTLDIKEKGLAGKTISFAFRPKDYFTDIFAYYYFRVLYLKENEEIYYPIDSNLGNLCMPKYNNVTGKYYCNLIFNNNYNELSRRFAISSTILNEYNTIYAKEIFKNKTVLEYTKKFVFVDLDSNEDIDYYLFHIEFPNGELKNIMSSVIDNVTELYPQIYSHQLFIISKSYKLNHFKMVGNYTFFLEYVYGYAGTVSINFLNYERFSCSRNFRGKPLSVTISSETDTINITTIRNNFAYFMKLQYNMKNKVVEEIKSGEIYSQFFIGRNFPLYFYLKVKNTKHINVDINFRINSYIDEVLRNNFEIRGYVLDEKTIQRKINGEFIQLNNPRTGYYYEAFKIGFLQINQEINNGENYILIEIRSGDKNFIETYLLVELIAKEFTNGTYFLPINQYLLETFDDDYNGTSTENNYYLSCLERWGDQALIDFSSSYDDIVVEFLNKTTTNVTEYYLDGFKKYRIMYAKDDNVYFKVVNPKQRKKASYMIRYYYTGYEYVYSVDDAHRIIDKNYINNNNVTITITYNSIRIQNSITNKDIENEKIYFHIFAFLFKKSDDSDEKLNTTSILVERKYLFHTNTTHYYHFSKPEKWNITFEDIPRSKNYKYELQLQVSSILPSNIFNEEFLIFTSEIDLTDIEYIDTSFRIWISVGAVLGAIVIALVIFFIVKYKKLKNSNVNLKEDLKSMAYSNNVQKNVLIKDQKSSQKDSDYESTFI